MASASPSVLVVDDEPVITRAITVAFGTRGYSVIAVSTGSEALHRLRQAVPSVILLDLGLPDLDGIEVCREIRTTSDVPIIVLTAEGAEDRKVAALDEGADDYVTKPFSMPELLARVRVALRHRRSDAAGLDQSVLEVGELRIEVAQHRVTLAGAPVELTPKEFGFLTALARHPGSVLTHRMILQMVWGPQYGKETQYLRVFAGQLRKKLRDDPANPRLVTEPGVGYRLVDPRRRDELDEGS